MLVTLPASSKDCCRIEWRADGAIGTKRPIIFQNLDRSLDAYMDGDGVAKLQVTPSDGHRVLFGAPAAIATLPDQCPCRYVRRTDCGRWCSRERCVCKEMKIYLLIKRLKDA